MDPDACLTTRLVPWLMGPSRIPLQRQLASTFGLHPVSLPSGARRTFRALEMASDNAATKGT